MKFKNTIVLNIDEGWYSRDELSEVLNWSEYLDFRSNHELYPVWSC